MAQTVKNTLTMQETRVGIPESGRFPREGNGNPIHSSVLCLEYSMDRGVFNENSSARESQRNCIS